MRADRLLSTLLVLQARGRVTAAELAEELEVSERTSRRDLEALAMAGVPVYSQAGRGGGWSLVGGARTDLSGLNADEARALFLLAGPAAGATPEVKTALRKLLRALPEPFRADAEAAATRIVRDPTAWDGRTVSAPAHLETLQRAVVDAVRVRLRYTDRDGRESERVVDPLGLVAKGQVWYLVAGTEAGQRTFRVSRVRAATPTGEPAARPEGFDLDEAWQSVLADIGQRRLPFAATVRADADTMETLRWVVGAGRVEVDGDHAVVSGQSAEMIAAELAGFGAQLEIVGPPDVRAELARIGAELVARYS